MYPAPSVTCCGRAPSGRASCCRRRGLSRNCGWCTGAVPGATTLRAVLSLAFSLLFAALLLLTIASAAAALFFNRLPAAALALATERGSQRAAASAATPPHQRDAVLHEAPHANKECSVWCRVDAALPSSAGFVDGPAPKVETEQQRHDQHWVAPAAAAGDKRGVVLLARVEWLECLRWSAHAAVLASPHLALVGGIGVVIARAVQLGALCSAGFNGALVAHIRVVAPVSRLGVYARVAVAAAKGIGCARVGGKGGGGGAKK